VTDEPHTGALIVLLPVASDPVREISQEDEAHVTTLWFGNLDGLMPDDVAGIRAAVTEVAGRYSEFAATVSGRAVLGADDAGVLLLESYELMEIRNELGRDEWVQAAYNRAEQFPAFVPHLTLTYGGGIPAGELPAEIQFGAIGLWLGGQHEAFPLLPVTEPEAAESSTDDDGVVFASGMIYPVDCPDDLPMAVQFATVHTDARWYVQKMARAYGVDCVPAEWATT
jgi:2'-5' RNA ligase